MYPLKISDTFSEIVEGRAKKGKRTYKYFVFFELQYLPKFKVLRLSKMMKYVYLLKYNIAVFLVILYK